MYEIQNKNTLMIVCCNDFNCFVDVHEIGCVN